MKNATMWLWWYGLLAGVPLVTMGLLLKDRMAAAVPQRVRSHRR